MTWTTPSAINSCKRKGLKAREYGAEIVCFDVANRVQQLPSNNAGSADQCSIDVARCAPWRKARVAYFRERAGIVDGEMRNVTSNSKFK